MKTQTPNAHAIPGVGASISWQGRLDEAQDPEEVVAVARDFLARLSPEEYSALPAECRPHKIVDADDVVDYAVTLVKGSCTGDGRSDTELQHLASFFTNACIRLSQLNRAAPELPTITQ